ncbi:transposase [Flavivirga rizhaonensis]|uniref:transposase n=1 Tax=Flavivirga rizhaonensis TaxID=2559571 RepID=UPI002939480D|nr:transposase [Flavivirga rizhaonensis]
MTKAYYGSSGQKSIDSVVFFKLCMVGYIENIISDRHLIRHSSMRLDILYFLDYDIDEELPWHSRISRTRQLYPESLFEQVFTSVLTMCVVPAIMWLRISRRIMQMGRTASVCAISVTA